ncbi:MAG TPA: RluA family pseudouridine synthase, partial [Chloroflexota bacterium]|nr:RluA family pseudouridine synthase [Chloroflexota bacterium]
VTVNGHPAGAKYVHCVPGDLVDAWYPEETTSVTPEPQLTPDILYEDESLVVVNKPAGQLSHPARSEQHGTVANAIAARYSGVGGAPEPVRLVHRLDRDTSGVLLFARTSAAARALARLRAAGTLVRDYLALVSGQPPSAGEINVPLGSDPAHRTRRIALVRADNGSHRVVRFTNESQETGPAGHEVGLNADLSFAAPFQEARTTYQVIQYGQNAALIAARLHTGRTHQLRAHMASIGHPLLGDDLYHGPHLPGLERQALHAWRVRLSHPMTGTLVIIQAPVPKDLREAARSLLGHDTESPLPAGEAE